MEVHGREEGDVEEHDPEDDQREGEGRVESIGTAVQLRLR